MTGEEDLAESRQHVPCTGHMGRSYRQLQLIGRLT